MTTPEHERAPPKRPASADVPPQSEALEAELAALEAILPAGGPPVAPKPGAATDGRSDEPAELPPTRNVPPAVRD